MTDNIVCRHLGVQFRPPAIILQYKEESSGQNRKRSIPVKGLTEKSDCGLLASRTVSRHKKYLGRVPLVRVEKMLRILQEHSTDNTANTGDIVARIEKEFQVDPKEDLNLLSDKELQRRKNIMELSFQKNNIGRDHPDFEYNKVVEFKKGKTAASEWDSDSSNSSTPVNSPLRQPDLKPGGKDLFGLSDEDDEPPEKGSSPSGLGDKALLKDREVEVEEEEEREKSVSCGEEVAAETDSDFW